MPGPPRFALAVSGAPALPSAGHWSAVRVDEATGDVTPVPRHGLPVVRRREDTAFTFRDAADSYRTAPGEYALLMATSAGRTLFPRPRIEPSTPRRLVTDPPLIADPYGLARASGLFPRPEFALRCLQPAEAEFDIADLRSWRLVTQQFTFAAPVAEVAQGADWLIERTFPEVRETGQVGSRNQLSLVLDSTGGAVPWSLGLDQPDDLRLSLPTGELLTIRSAFRTASGTRPGLVEPDVVLGPLLAKVQDVVNALKHFVGLGFDIDVDVESGAGPDPSFVVLVGLRLRVPAHPHERIDIGIGKFRGHFQVDGAFHARPSGPTRANLSVELIGDVQQAIIPPLLYAGGQFRFVAQIDDSGTPVVELGLGTAASLGGDLVKNLIELEATVRYGYTLIPKTFEPGVMLGIEARAKLLAGLLGISFGTDVMARIARLDPAGKTVTIWAEVRAAATVQVAYLIEEDFDLRTQFEQELPLELLAVAVAGVNPLTAVAASELL